MFIQVINLDISTDRRNRYEKAFLDHELNFTRLRATNGINDLAIIELSKNRQCLKEINTEDLKNNNFLLKSHTLYKVFDKKDQNIAFYYNFEPEKMIFRKKTH